MTTSVRDGVREREQERGRQTKTEKTETEKESTGQLEASCKSDLLIYIRMT